MADKDKTGVEDLQKDVLEVQLRTQKAMLAREEATLEQTLEATSEYKQKRKIAKATNEQRQRQFRADEANRRAIQHQCEHRAGGYAGESSILEGDGFSVLHVTIMPDGKHEFIQCTRCGLKLWGRQRTATEEARLEAAAEAVQKKDPKNYMHDPVWLKWDDHCWWKELKSAHKKHGIKKSVMRGPTFTFQNADGVNFIPDLR